LLEKNSLSALLASTASLDGKNSIAAAQTTRLPRATCLACYGMVDAHVAQYRAAAPHRVCAMAEKAAQP